MSSAPATGATGRLPTAPPSTRTATPSSLSLDRLLHLHPRLKLILVLDNASYHRSKAVQAALSHWGDRLLLIWLPKYSPFLNPIERFWLHFKQLTVANRLHRSPDDLQITVDQVIANQNTPDHPNRLLFVDNFRLVA
ncbi:MAG: transposase [Chloroflexi bacterium]|nr:transposase [Chloroflexota bacterium]